MRFHELISTLIENSWRKTINRTMAFFIWWISNPSRAKRPAYECVKNLKLKDPCSHKIQLDYCKVAAMSVFMLHHAVTWAQDGNGAKVARALPAKICEKVVLVIKANNTFRCWVRKRRTRSLCQLQPRYNPKAYHQRWIIAGSAFYGTRRINFWRAWLRACVWIEWRCSCHNHRP